jgi:hypothetical protein
MVSGPSTNGDGRRSDGRFGPGNTAARRHGLRAASRTELRRRDRRASRLLAYYQDLRAGEGRSLRPSQLPLARRFCEAEVLATDRYALVSQSPGNGRALDEFLAIVRVQVSLARELGETATAITELGRVLNGGLAQQLAQRRAARALGASA